MNKKKITRSFFIRPTLWVAKNLLGKYIVRIYKNKKIIGKIVETEAYIGPNDKASHTYLQPKLRKRGIKVKITPRNKAEFLKGGHIYIYLVYGMYWQLNISAYKEEFPECVLIRAIEPTNKLQKIKIQKSLRGWSLSGAEPKCKMIMQNSKSFKNLIKMTNGPGKLCKYLKLDKSFYAEDVCHSKRIWLEDRGNNPKISEIKKGPRIGIDYAGPYWSKVPWRFWIKDNPFISK